MNIGPGRIIQRNLKALGWSGTKLAAVLGMSDASLRLLLRDERGISAEEAMLLGRAFDSSSEFWLKLDQVYRQRRQNARGSGRPRTPHRGAST